MDCVHSTCNRLRFSLANFQPNSPEPPLTAPIVLQMSSSFKLSLYNQCLGSYNSLYFSTSTYQPHLVHDRKLKLTSGWEVNKRFIVCGACRKRLGALPYSSTQGYMSQRLAAQSSRWASTVLFLGDLRGCFSSNCYRLKVRSLETHQNPLNPNHSIVYLRGKRRCLLRLVAAEGTRFEVETIPALTRYAAWRNASTSRPAVQSIKTTL
jgi:uncharacterized CHY-type Zn-finger protein